jgi:hypothetical protein
MPEKKWGEERSSWTSSGKMRMKKWPWGGYSLPTTSKNWEIQANFYIQDWGNQLNKTDMAKQN